MSNIYLSRTLRQLFYNRDAITFPKPSIAERYSRKKNAACSNNLMRHKAQISCGKSILGPERLYHHLNSSM